MAESERCEVAMSQKLEAGLTTGSSTSTDKSPILSPHKVSLSSTMTVV
jgi:hypothetical protein